FIGVPSDCSPVVLTFTPPSAASRALVRLLTGLGGGLNFDFARFSFQVPMLLSAAKAPSAVMATVMKSLDKMVLIFQFSFSFLSDNVETAWKSPRRNQVRSEWESVKE